MKSIAYFGADGIVLFTSEYDENIEPATHEGLSWVELETELPSTSDDYYKVQGGSVSVYVPPVDLDALRASKWEEIKAARDAEDYGGFDSPFGRFDSDEKSQSKIMGGVMFAMVRGDTFTIDWTLADNSNVTLNKTQMFAVGVLLGQHLDQSHQKGRALYDQIEASDATVESIQAVTWS